MYAYSPYNSLHVTYFLHETKSRLAIVATAFLPLLPEKEKYCEVEWIYQMHTHTQTHRHASTLIHSRIPTPYKLICNLSIYISMSVHIYLSISSCSRPSICLSILVCFVFCLVWFYGISNIIGYLMPNLINTFI